MNKYKIDWDFFFKKRFMDVFFLNKRSSFLTYMFLYGIILCASYELIFNCSASKAFLVCIFSFTCVVTGGMFGFLFGIPKNPQKKDSKSDENSEKNSDDSQSSFQENTNLQEISDWMTKIIVGVGLTQFRSIYEEFINISKKISSETLIGPESLSGMIIFYFYIVGFFAAYFWAKFEYDNLMHAKMKKKLSTIENKFHRMSDKFETSIKKMNEESNIREQIVKMANILSSESDKIDIKSKAQYIPKLIQIIKSNPGNRMANIVLARFYAELYQDYPKAINTLNEFIRYKQSKNEKDEDLADAIYNKASYEMKTGNKSGFIHHMKASFEILPSNKQYAKDDPEFIPLANDPDFINLIS